MQNAVGKVEHIFYCGKVGSIVTYQEALDYLYSFVVSQQPAATPEAAMMKLERMRVILGKLGNPQNALLCILVAGTKGKGSTSAMVESIVRAAGYRTGLWTSPHLHTYRERIQVDRQFISQDALIRFVTWLCPIIEGFDTQRYGYPTTFELGFAIALGYFVEQGVELAILEVGLGGRYDSTNVVMPLVSVISSISYDHMNVLGYTLTEIAYDKAGIMRYGIPTATVVQRVEAARVLAHVACEVGAPLWVAKEHAVELQCNEQADELWVYPCEPAPALQGHVQRENARLALATAFLLRGRGFSLSDDVCTQGLALVCWPGRLEVVSTSPLLVLDGAHNGDSAEKLVKSLHAAFGFARCILILGLSCGKDAHAITSVLVPHADVVVLTHSHHPRAQRDMEQLAAAVTPYLHGILHVVPDIAVALAQSRSLAQANDLICVTGSLFVVAAAREVLGLAEAQE